MERCAPLRRLYSTFAGGWPGAGLLLMRLVVGSALIVHASFRLGSDSPPVSVTIPALLLMGAGILLIAGLWTPIAGTLVALTEIWKMAYASRRQVGLGAVRECRCCARNVRTRFLVGRCSPLWLETPRS
jgi:hypothetical protein